MLWCKKSPNPWGRSLWEHRLASSLVTLWPSIHLSFPLYKWVVIFFSMMLQLWVFLSEELNSDTLIFSQGRQTLLLLGTKLLKDWLCGQFKKQPYKLIMVFIVGKVFYVIGINVLFEAWGENSTRPKCLGKQYLLRIWWLFCMIIRISVTVILVTVFFFWPLWGSVLDFWCTSP